MSTKKEQANIRSAGILMATATFFSFLFQGSGKWILLALAIYTIYEGWMK